MSFKTEVFFSRWQNIPMNSFPSQNSSKVTAEPKGKTEPPASTSPQVSLARKAVRQKKSKLPKKSFCNWQGYL